MNGKHGEKKRLPKVKSEANLWWVASVLLLLCGTYPAWGQNSDAKPKGANSSTESVAEEFIRLTPHEGNPVFSALGKGSWEVKIRERGWILWDEDHYKLWYTGYDGTRSGQKKLGLATSRDGVVWKRHKKNPIYDDHWVEDMMVVKNGDEYLMFAEGKGDQSHLLRSEDGISWRRDGVLDIRRASDGQRIEAGPFGTPVALRVDGVWHLFYERRDQGIWLATSKDLKTWTNVQDEPVIRLGTEGFDTRMIALNQVFRWGDRYLGLYHGTSSASKPRAWTCGIVVSEDLSHWKRIDKNPILPAKWNQSSGIFVFRPSRRLRFYTMHDQVHLYETPALLNSDATRFQSELPVEGDPPSSLETPQRDRVPRKP